MLILFFSWDFFNLFSPNTWVCAQDSAGWKEEKWILHQPHLYLHQSGLENSFNFSQTHPLIWTGHVISLSIYPTCSGHKFSFSFPGLARQAAVLCGWCSLQTPARPIKASSRASYCGVFSYRLRADMLWGFNSSLHLSWYIPGGRYRTCNHSWWMWQWATEAEKERSN